MRIYFSGGGGLNDTPEALVPHLKPHIMLTFHTLRERQAASTDRLRAHLRRKESVTREQIRPKKT